MAWILAAVFAVLAAFELYTARSACRKLNTLNEYVQFLLFQPKVYNDHRDKFLSFLSQMDKTDVGAQAMASYQAVENMALALEDKILLANVLSRSEGARG